MNDNKKMELDRILSEVRQQMEYTVISYRERDPNGSTFGEPNYKWGNPSYNGNCSGKVPLGFIDKLGAKSVAEIYAGSGTLSDVCRDYNIPYCGIDLNPNPVRDNIYFMDILDMEQELPPAFHCADMVFQHPPYPGLNHVKYADKAWKDTTGGSLIKKDIQNMSFEEGMKMINTATLRAYSAMCSGSFMVILVGEIRSKGQYYSMYKLLALPGEVFQTYVKMQHNTASDRRGGYNNRNQRALTSHEMIAVIKKPSGYEIMYVMPRKYILDVRDSNMATWSDIVMAYAREVKTFSNSQIKNDLGNHKKGKNNSNVDAKLRQTCARLASNGLLMHISEGMWQVAA